MNEGMFKLSKKQVEFLLNFTGEHEPNEAVEIFAKAMLSEGISPEKLPQYLNKLMKKIGTVK